MSRFVRASKFRHVYGSGSKQENTYLNVKPSRNAWDSNLITANTTYVAVCWEQAGGGAFAVLRQDKVGKLAPDQPLFLGHKAVVLDLDFHPHNEHIIASCSEDGKVMIWNIPEDLSQSVTVPAATLSGHARKVGQVLFNPNAENVLASSSGDLAIKLWDIEKSQEKMELLGNTDLVQNMCWNENGNLLGTTCRDKKIRVFDVRANKMVQEVQGHQGIKSARIVWLGSSNQFATTGFSKTSERQLFIWDSSDLNQGPLAQENLDTSSGTMMPFYDPDCKMLYLAGKGDGNIRYFEMVDEKPWCFSLSEYRSSEPQRGMAFVPKRGVNVTEIEVAKCFKLTTTAIEPISFKVPRKTDVFQADLYPDAIGPDASLTADEFFSGKECPPPKRISMENGFTAGVRKTVNFTSAAPQEEHKKDLDNPKTDKEFQEAFYKLKKEVEELTNKLAQKDVQIRQLELKLSQ